jgi:predicted ATPase
LNSQVAGLLIQWFDEDLDFYDMHRNPNAESVMLTQTARLLRDDNEFSALIVQFMKDADIGIQDLQIADEKTLKAEVSERDNKLEVKESVVPGISFRHSSYDGSEVFFPRHKESSGTLRFVALLVAILKPSTRRRFVCIDELSASMHPELVCRLIRIVHSGVFNRLGNQVMFTTHDTHLIEPTELLRRDQITLCNKDRFGRSSLRRLDEFQDSARSDANLQKQYLQGRFGGTPQFGVTLEDVPVDDKPLEVCS